MSKHIFHYLLHERISTFLTKKVQNFFMFSAGTSGRDASQPESLLGSVTKKEDILGSDLHSCVLKSVPYGTNCL